ncbi:MAG TPA: DegT/DnrJ/EryC1/StrS family aminotransferase [Nitrospiria bacterium]|nr:DegT/DnrJ/EryC1/StrS family aminotransferase [Nitrospiria bacterium]
MKQATSTRTESDRRMDIQASPPLASRFPLSNESKKRRWIWGTQVPPVRYPLASGNVIRAVLRMTDPPPKGLYLSSGEEALEIALRGTREHLGKGRGTEVIVPDFVCPSVVRAVRAAGLVPRVCELDPRRWFYNPEALEKTVGKETCAVVVVAFFGNLPVLDPPSRARALSILGSVPVVEDYAQAFGLEQPTKSWPGSVFRVYSFGRGKSLPLGWGGLLEGFDEAAESWLNRLRAQYGKYRLLENLVNLAMSQAQSLVLHPLLWRFVPISYEMMETTDFRQGRGGLGWPVTNYIAASRQSLREEISARHRNIGRFVERLQSLPGIEMAFGGKQNPTEGVAVRFPVLFENPEIAEAVKRAIAKEGVIRGPNEFFDHVSSTENSASICRRLLTLPTFSGSERALERAANLIRKFLSPSNGAITL